MAVDYKALGNVLLVVLTLLVLIGIGNLVFLAARSALRRRKWDFFFSYKAENANEVRRIAERLMADGYRIWFAEYEIFLRNYEDFEPRIRKGIQHSSFGILFTTTNYSQSKYCRDEVTWLQQRFVKEPWRIIEISIEEPNDVRHILGLSSQSPRIIAPISSRIPQKHEEDDNLLTRLAILTGLDLNRGSMAHQLGSSAPWFHARCAPVTFHPAGFVLKDWEEYPDDNTDVVSFECESSPVLFSFNVYFHYLPQSTPGQPFTISADPLNDRKLYAELRKFGMYFMKQPRKRGVFLRERGLHLIWLNGRTQMALTHSFLWVRMRKYSIILVQLPQPIQLIFTFAVTGSFDDFYRLVPLMDHIIESVRVEGP